MAQSKYDLILHPVRLQILHALEGGSQMTMRELEARLADIPPVTLSRHLDLLVDGGMIVVAGERLEHGAPEPVYSVGETDITPYEKQGATPADHLRYFTTFAAGLIGMFSRYVKRPGADVARDRVTYRQHTMFLTDEELAALQDDLEARFGQKGDDASSRDRRPHVISWVILPETQPRDAT